MTICANKIIIDGYDICDDALPYCIAEVGINHNGDLTTALKMIEIAKISGADAVKFQTFSADEFCGDSEQLFTYMSKGTEITERMISMFKRYELSQNDWSEIKRFCNKIGITFFSTPQNETDLDMLLKIGVPAIKVGSDDFTNHPLLKVYASKGLPLILSCGMSDLSEIYQSLDVVGAIDGYPTILLLCTSQYPTPPEDVNLNKITTLRAAFPMVKIGFSDHTVGSLAASLAVALGASVFEKHFTLDHNMDGPDHWFSADPGELSSWVEQIKLSKKMLGSAIVRPTQAEFEIRKSFRRYIVAEKTILANEVFSENNINLKRTANGLGLPASFLSYVLGRKAARNYRRGEAIEL